MASTNPASIIVTMTAISPRSRIAVPSDPRPPRRNRNALNAVDPSSYMQGAAFLQFSCQGSEAQEKLTQLADAVADHYEDRVGYHQNVDPDLESWTAGEHRPRTSDMMPFDHAVHANYSRGNFNRDELPFAQALDAYRRGVWVRNPDSGGRGYHVPLPYKVGDSLKFFPDFLWWPDGPDGIVWAIDTTGRHLLQEKIRGKLVALGQPKMALVVRGHSDVDRKQVVGRDGWSAVIARAGTKPLVHHVDDLQRLLELLVAS